MNNSYRNQVTLLLEVLPHVVKGEPFILKGGTAINLFIQNFPRLSVDIDLTYNIIEDRISTLQNIQTSLLKISKKIKKNIKNASVNEKLNIQTKTITKLDIFRDSNIVKIEPNFILRGNIFPSEFKSLHPSVENEFGMDLVDIPVSNVAELYGSKICAALDRQHPRDLFDIKILLNTYGITQKIKQAFIYYLCSHNRPMHELLNPRRLDHSQIFITEFQGMANTSVTYQELKDALNTLLSLLKKSLTDEDKMFLCSFNSGEQNWGLIGMEDLSYMPSIKWKQMNLKRMDSSKQLSMLKELAALLR